MAILLLTSLMLVPATSAIGYWTGDGNGTGGAQTGFLLPPTDVTVPATSPPEVSVSWTPPGSGVAPSGYVVSRLLGSVEQPACGTTAAAPTTGTSCVDEAVTPGSYTYRVTAVFRSWTAVSASSGTVVVLPYGGLQLGAAGKYSVLGGNVVNTLETAVSGDLGVSPAGAVSGFPPGTVGGTIHLNDLDAAAASAVALLAYTDARSRDNTTTFDGDQIGKTFTAGVHRTGAAFANSGTMTLSGDANSVFIFQIDAALNTAAASRVLLVGGVLPSNVYWQANGAATLGANSAFAGTILTDGAITIGAGTTLIGRALAVTTTPTPSTVTMANNTIRFTVAPAPTISITGGPNAVTKAPAASNTATPTIAGSTNAGVGRVVTITIGGQTLTGIVQADGTWSVVATALPAGRYPVVAKVKDAAGNGATANQTLLVEANPQTIALGAAQNFSVFAGRGVVGNGTSALNRDIGVALGTITGFPPGTIGGQTHVSDLPAFNAQTAIATAYADGDGRAPHTEFAGDQIGRTFHAGVHHSATAFALSGTMTLDGENQVNPVFIFQIDAAMNTAANTQVVLVNGATAANVFWIVDGAVTTGATSSLVGTVLTSQAMTLGAGMQLGGRALTTGGVTLGGNTVNTP